ncbi:unnamed protein product, partial [Rhizoctonia solani]
MKKARGLKSRFKAGMKIFYSDNQLTRPLTPVPMPTDHPGQIVDLATGQASIHSTQPLKPDDLAATVPSQTTPTVPATEQGSSHTHSVHTETLAITLLSESHSRSSPSQAVEQNLALKGSQTQAPVKPLPQSASLEAMAAPVDLPVALDKRTVSSRLGILSRTKSEGWANLKAFLDTVNQATSISGLGPVKTVVEGLASCIEIYQEAGQGRQAYDELRVQLEATFEELSQYFSPSPVITASIENICGSIQKELEYFKAQQAKPIGRQLAEAEMKAEEILECYRRIKDHLQRLARNANISTWVIVDKFATDNHLQKLAPSLWACYNSEKATELKRGPCTEGTRTNVLIPMHEWASSLNSGGVYWMNGMAGTGKTTIAYSLCQQLDAPENRLLCASFFCSRSLPECRSVGRIIPSIAYQIAQCSRPFRYALSKATEENPDAHTRSAHLQFDSLILQPLSDIRVREAFPRNMVVVIDALDECEDTKSTQQILEVLLTKSKGLPLKFVVSSRPEAAIRHQMEKNGTWIDSRVVLHELDSGEVQTDIKTYLKAELAPVQPSDMEIKKLADRAGVLFIYAATVIRYVGYDDFGRNPRARLNAVLYMSERRGNVQTREIDRLYGGILEAAINDDQLEEVEREELKLVLNTVVCAKAPLTVSALNELLQLNDAGRVHAALRPLWSVLHLMGSSMAVTTLHASFPDYLTDPKRSGNMPWHCNAAAHHHLIAQRCFQNICTTRPQFNICQFGSSYLKDEEVENLDARVEKYISLELRYACQYWSAHLDASGLASALLCLLEQFLSKHLLLWLEVMNLTKIIGTSPDSLSTAKQWAARNGATRELLALTQDAWRFAFTVVSSPVSKSTPHIYISMLPFLPSHSLIRKHYAHRMRGVIGIYGTALERRTPLLAQWTLKLSSRTACSPDGTLVAKAPGYSEDYISLIDTSSGQIVRDLPRKDMHMFSCVAFSPDGTHLTSGASGTHHTSGARGWVICVWDVGTGQLVLGPVNGHANEITSIIFSHGGSFIISGSADNSIRVWDACSGTSVFVPLIGHTNRVTSIATSSGDTKIISGSEDCTVRVWDMQSGRLVLDPMIGHTEAVSSVVISPDDLFIVSGSYDCTVRAWDSQTGGMLLVLEPCPHDATVYSIAISPDGAHISAGLDNGTIQTWDATGRTVSAPLNENLKNVFMLTYSSDGTRIISCSRDFAAERICLFDVQSATDVLDSLPGHSGPTLSIDISPDGMQIVSGSEDTSLCVWDPINGQLVLGPLIGHTRGVQLVRYSENGSRILSCSYDRTLCQWDAQTGDSLQVNNLIVDTFTPYGDHNGRGFCAASYSKDGSYIATISSNASVCVWNSSTGEMIQGPMNTHRLEEGQAVVFSVDGTTVMTGWDDGAVRIWDVQSGQLVSDIRPQKELFALAFEFSPDRLYSVMAGLQFGLLGPGIYRTITQTGEQTPDSFEGITGSMACVRFSHDSTRIVTGSHNHTVHLWDAQTGESIFGSLRGHSKPVRSVSCSPDSAYIVSGSEDRSIRIWDAKTQPNSTPLIA